MQGRYLVVDGAGRVKGRDSIHWARAKVGTIVGGKIYDSETGQVVT